MYWSKLSMADRAKYIELAVANGVTNLGNIRDTYNLYADGGPEEKGFWDTVDDYVADAEMPIAVASMAASGATLAFPGFAPAAVITNLTGAGIDLYQGTRAAIRGDWPGVAQNALEFGLSLVGAKELKAGEKLMKLDKALNASGAPRQYVTKTVGRGRGKHTTTMTKERAEAIRRSGAGAGMSIGSDISSATGFARDEAATRGSNRVSLPQDNTRNMRHQPILIDVPTDNEVDLDWIEKQRRYVEAQRNYGK